LAREILYKTTTEKVVYAIDVVADVPSGGAISSVAGTAVDSSGAVVSSTVLGTVTSSGTVVSIQLKATSVDKEVYTVRIAVTMNDALPTVANRILEVRVRDDDTVE